MIVIPVGAIVLAVLYCVICGKRTDHRVTSSKEWEHYTCTVCNHTQDFKVK